MIAIFIMAFSHIGCKNVEQEQVKLAQDSLNIIRRNADSIEQITAFPGARFGCSPDEFVQAAEKFNLINNYSIKGFKYDHIVPYYYENGLMEIKIIGKEYNWSEYETVYNSVENCMEMFTAKYGPPIDFDSTLEKRKDYKESKMIGWEKGDKGVSFRIISDYDGFLLEIDIWSEKIRKAYIHNIVEGITNPL